LQILFSYAKSSNCSYTLGTRSRRTLHAELAQAYRHFSSDS
jgi:hypothetical protein